MPRGLGRATATPRRTPAASVLDCTGLDAMRPSTGRPAWSPPPAGVSLARADAALRAPRLVRAGHPRHPATSPSAARSRPTSTARTTTATARFGAHVRSLDLVTADGTVSTLEPRTRPELFWATVGGMGLTGVVLEATFGCVPVETRPDAWSTPSAPPTSTTLMARDGERRRPLPLLGRLDRPARPGRGGWAAAVLTAGDHARPTSCPPAGATARCRAATRAARAARAPGRAAQRG